MNGAVRGARDNKVNHCSVLEANAQESSLAYPLHNIISSPDPDLPPFNLSVSVDPGKY